MTGLVLCAWVPQPPEPDLPAGLQDARFVIVHTTNNAGFLKSCACSKKKDIRGLAWQAAALPSDGQSAGNAKQATLAILQTQEARSADVTILLSQMGAAGDIALAKAAAAQNTQLDLILAGANWSSLTVGVRLGGTIIAPTASGGKEVVLALRDGTPGEKKWHFYRLPTSLAREPDPDVAEWIEDYYRERQETVRTLAQSTPVKRLTYVRAQECGKCHRPQYVSWKVAKHALAMEALVTQNRVAPECLVCHSYRFRRDGVLADASNAAAAGVECASCHGVGLLHAISEEPQHIVRAPAEETCLECHTPERSPDFDFAAYLSHIRHKE